MKQGLLGSAWLTLLAVSFASAQEASLQKTIAAHDNPVFCAAFSPDGRLAATGSLREAKLWDMATGKSVATLSDAGLVGFVQFSPDGRKLALSTAQSTAQGEQGAIRVWDVATRKKLATLQTYNSGSFMAFQPDGEALIWTDNRSFAPDGKTGTWPRHMTLKVWNMRTGRSTPLCCLYKNNEELRLVVALAFSQDNKILAARDQMGVIEIWDLAACRKTAVLCDNVDLSSFSVAFSPDGKILASGGAHKAVRLWDVATAKSIAILRGHCAEVVAFSPDGKTLASAGYGDTIRLWDVATRKNIGNMNAGSKAVNCVVFSPDGKALLSAGHDGTIRLWNVYTSGRKIGEQEQGTFYFCLGEAMKSG